MESREGRMTAFLNAYEVAVSKRNLSQRSQLKFKFYPGKPIEKKEMLFKIGEEIVTRFGSGNL